MLRQAFRQRQSCNQWLRTVAWVCQSDLLHSTQPRCKAAQSATQISATGSTLSSLVSISPFIAQHSPLTTLTSAKSGDEEEAESVPKKQKAWRKKHGGNHGTRRQRPRGIDSHSWESRCLDSYHQMTTGLIPHHIYVYTNAMKIYAQRNNFDKVEEVFKKFQATGRELDVILMNTYIFAHRIIKDLKSALDVADSMERKHGIRRTDMTYRALMIVSSLAGDRSKTEEHYTKLLEMSPDFRTYNCYIDAVGNLTSPETIRDDLATCQKIFTDFKSLSGKPPNIKTYSFMVALCLKGGLLDEAFEYMEQSLKHIGGTSYYMYDSLFGCLANKNMPEEELDERMMSAVKRMIEEGLYLSARTVQNVIDVFNRHDRPMDAYRVLHTLRERDRMNHVGVLEATVFCIELLTRKDVTAFENGPKLISKTVRDFEKTGVIMKAAGFKSWIDTCVMVSDFKGAQECWQMDREREPKPSGETANTLIEFSLKRGTLRTAMDVLDFLLEREVTPTLKQLLMFVEYMEESGDTTKAEWLGEKMNATDFEPSENLRERMADLTATQKEATESA